MHKILTITDIYKRGCDSIESAIENIRGYDIQWGTDKYGLDTMKTLIVEYYDYSVYEYPIETYKQKIEAVRAVNKELRRRQKR